MAVPETLRVTGPGSLRRRIDTATWPMDSSQAAVLVRFEGGVAMLVPLEALVRQEDGSYHLTLDSATFERREAGAGYVSLPWCGP